jgi:hypothetical protein
VDALYGRAWEPSHENPGFRPIAVDVYQEKRAYKQHITVRDTGLMDSKQQLDGIHVSTAPILLSVRLSLMVHHTVTSGVPPCGPGSYSTDAMRYTPRLDLPKARLTSL